MTGFGDVVLDICNVCIRKSVTALAEAASPFELLSELHLLLLQYTVLCLSLGLPTTTIGNLLTLDFSQCGVYSTFKSLLLESFRNLSSQDTQAIGGQLSQFLVRSSMFARFFKQTFEFTALVQSGTQEAASLIVIH